MVKQQQCARKRKPLWEAELAWIGRHRRKQNSTYSLPAAGGSDRVRAWLHDALTAAEDFVDAAAVRRALADLRSHIAAKAGVPSNGSTAPIGQPANPVVWQPGVRLDEVATMHALELAYGGPIRTWAYTLPRNLPIEAPRSRGEAPACFVGQLVGWGALPRPCGCEPASSARAQSLQWLR